MLSKKSYKEKPYNRCLFCDYRNNGCNGPRTSAMEIERWREFMRDMKEVEGLTYAEISKRSGLPSKTIEKKLSPGGDGQDIMRETARLIEAAIIGSSNQYPCYMAFMENVPDNAKAIMSTEAEMAELRQNIKYIHESYKEELSKVRDECQEKVNYLLKELQRKDAIIDKLLDKR